MASRLRSSIMTQDNTFQRIWTPICDLADQPARELQHSSCISMTNSKVARQSSHWEEESTKLAKIQSPNLVKAMSKRIQRDSRKGSLMHILMDPRTDSFLGRTRESW